LPLKLIRVLPLLSAAGIWGGPRPIANMNKYIPVKLIGYGFVIVPLMLLLKTFRL
jgi:hypothetical protein